MSGSPCGCLRIGTHAADHTPSPLTRCPGLSPSGVSVSWTGPAERASTPVACRRLMAVPGIGVLTATALVAAVGDAKAYRNGRQMAAWLGLVPRQRSTGGRAKLLGISKRGDRYLRTLLIHGARSSLRFASRRPDRRSRWAVVTEKRRGRNIAGVALANKNARTAWAVLTRGTEFDVDHLGSAA